MMAPGKTVLMNSRRHWYLLYALLSTPALGFAQQVQPAAELEEIRRYTVEVIIFRYAQDVSSGSERFMPDEPPSTPLETVDEDAPLVSTPAYEAPVEPGPEPEPMRDLGLEFLGEDQLTMSDVLAKLDRLDAYEPLMHFGWTQSAWLDEETEPLNLATFASPPAGLDGTLELYLSRYLHLVVNLELDAPENTVIGGSADGGSTGDSDFLGYLDADEAIGRTRYRIQENRILKNGDLRYFDHPKFGVLAKVTRVEDDGEKKTELLGY